MRGSEGSSVGSHEGDDELGMVVLNSNTFGRDDGLFVGNADVGTDVVGDADGADDGWRVG